MNAVKSEKQAIPVQDQPVKRPERTFGTASLQKGVLSREAGNNSPAGNNLPGQEIGAPAGLPAFLRQVLFCILPGIPKPEQVLFYRGKERRSAGIFGEEGKKAP